MIELLKNSIIPLIVFDLASENVIEIDPKLYESMDSDYRYQNDKKFYDGITKEGWCVSSKGYATYSIFTDEFKIIFVGMKVKGLSKISGKQKGIPFYFQDRIFVERYIVSLIHSFGILKDEMSQPFYDFSHELKSIISGILSKIALLKKEIDETSSLYPHIENIRALSEILNTKGDLFKFLSSGKISSLKESNIVPYKKFEKIKKCLTTTALKKQIQISMEGNSYKSINDGVSGFEIIPYLLIENALKYSPQNYEVIVSIEDKQNSVLIDIESVGPYLQKDEYIKIFQKGYRGKQAKQATPNGSGLGLFTVKTFLEKAYGGSVSAAQNGSCVCTLNGISYYFTKFHLEIPV